MKYTKENIIEGINVKLDELFGGSPATKPIAMMYKTILSNYPVEIEQNVLEWVNNLPFSDVDCYGISVKSVVDCMELSEFQIPQLFRNFIEFKENGFKGTAVCYRGF